MAHEQLERVQTIEEEIEHVKRRLGRIWQVIETTDIEMADASERIRKHRETVQPVRSLARRYPLSTMTSSTAVGPPPLLSSSDPG